MIGVPNRLDDGTIIDASRGTELSAAQEDEDRHQSRGSLGDSSTANHL